MKNMKKSILDELNTINDHQESRNPTSRFILENKPIEHSFKDYKICDSKACFCTGNCISRGELNKERAIAKEFGK